jgi:hypothetical protein
MAHTCNPGYSGSRDRRRLGVQSQPVQVVLETLSPKRKERKEISKKKKKKGLTERPKP